MIAALFSFYNRYVDGLGTIAPTDPAYYRDLAERLKTTGYYRAEDSYDHLKNSDMEEAGIEAGEGRRNAGAYPYVLFAICFLAGVFGGITSTLMSAYLPDVVGELTGITGAGGMEQAGAAINAAFLFGMTFGGLMVGYLSDLWGRKNAVLLSIGCIGVFTLLTAFADHWMLVVGLRFFGSGSAASW